MPSWYICGNESFRGPVFAGGGFSAEAIQFFARLNTDPGTTRKNLYAALIDSLVSAGAWSGIDVLQIYAADTSANALINLKSSSFTASLNNTPTFTADRGFTGVGSNGYIITGFNASTAGGSYTQDAASFGLWSRTAVFPFGMCACESAATGQSIYPKFVDGKTYMRCNDNPEAGGFILGLDATGFYFAVRTSSTGRTGYRNGVSIGTIGSTASQAPINSNFAVPVAEGGSGNVGEVACFIAGGNLDSVQGAIYTALNTYMVAVGAA